MDYRIGGGATMMWHRASESIEHEPAPDVPRPFLYCTPVLREDLSRYLSYPVTNTELGVSLVITRIRERLHSDYPELLMKQAMWTIKHLCEYTDIVDTGTLLRLSISTDMHQTAMPYLEACNFPVETIHWFESRESEYKHISKLDALRHPDFGDIPKRLHMDIALRIGTHPTQRQLPLIERVLMGWTSQPLAVARLKRERDPQKNMMVQLRPTDPVEWQQSILTVLKAAAQLSGNTFESERAYWERCDPMWDLLGGWLGMTTALMDDCYFQEVFRAISPHGAEQRALMVYCRLMGWSEREVCILRDTIPAVTSDLYVGRGLGFAYPDIDVESWLANHKQYKNEG